MSNILFLGAGGPAAVGAIKSLLKHDSQGEHKIVSIDMDETAVGFHFSDKKYVVPRCTDSLYSKIVTDIIEKENIDLILPTGGDVVTISKLDLPKNVKVFMSNHESIEICNDKWKFYNKVKDDFDIPYTWQDNDIKWNGCFARPRYELGGSRGAIYCKDIHQYMSTYNSDVEYIYSDYLPGQEYTIDVLCDMKKPLISVVRKRLQTKAGISTKGKIIRDEYIENECIRICDFLNLKGAICIQMKEDKNGVPKFVEINPRFGGGTYFTTLSGVNFVGLILDIINGVKVKISKPKEITVLRHFEEVII